MAFEWLFAHKLEKTKRVRAASGETAKENQRAQLRRASDLRARRLGRDTETTISASKQRRKFFPTKRTRQEQKKGLSDCKLLTMNIPSSPSMRGSSKMRYQPPMPHTHVLGNVSSSCLSSSTELQSSDGEEILSPLDEEALAALPEFLQVNMVDLQMSRVEKWQKKIQETIERNYAWKKMTRFDSNVAREHTNPPSSRAQPRYDSDLDELSKFEKRRLRRSRSADILYDQETGRFSLDGVRRPQTADATSSPRLENAETMLQRYQAVSVLRNKALFSNQVTEDERCNAIQLSAKMGLRPTVTRFAVPVKRSQELDAIHTRKPSLRDRLKYLKAQTMQALGSQKPGQSRKLQKSKERSMEQIGPVLRQKLNPSPIYCTGLDRGTRSYRAHLEGYGF